MSDKKGYDYEFFQDIDENRYTCKGDHPLVPRLNEIAGLIIPDTMHLYRPLLGQIMDDHHTRSREGMSIEKSIALANAELDGAEASFKEHPHWIRQPFMKFHYNKFASRCSECGREDE